MRNLLFVCSRNQWRSPTAEKIFQKEADLNVRSAGTSSSARRKVSEKDLQWADLIFVMEKRHLAQLRRKFGHELHEDKVVVLHIPDEYEFMDPALVELLRDLVTPYF